MSYTVGTEKYDLGAGDILVIPAEKYHLCDRASEDVERCAFMIDTDIKKVICTHISPFTVKAMMNEIDLVKRSENYARVIGYVSLIFSQIYDDLRITAGDNLDDAFIIDSYIEKNYARSPSLKVLASELNLSVKQAARLVYKYLGCSFSEAINVRRMNEVKALIASGKMTKKEISEYVGYSSYSGFYKTYKRFFGK